MEADNMEDEDKIRRFAEAEIIKLENLLFKILPEDCMLKPGKGLAKESEEGLIEPGMTAISPSIPRQFLYRKDICMLCRTTVCHWNSKVGPEWVQWFRAWKIYLLSKIFRDSNANFVRNLNEN